MDWPLIADALAACLAAWGHGAMAIYFITRLHATGWDHKLLKAIDWVWLAVVPAVPLAIAWGYVTGAIPLWLFGAARPLAEPALWPSAAVLAATVYLTL